MCVCMCVCARAHGCMCGCGCAWVCVYMAVCVLAWQHNMYNPIQRPWCYIWNKTSSFLTSRSAKAQGLCPTEVSKKQSGPPNRVGSQHSFPACRRALPCPLPIAILLPKLACSIFADASLLFSRVSVIPENSARLPPRAVVPRPPLSRVCIFG